MSPEPEPSTGAGPVTATVTRPSGRVRAAYEEALAGIGGAARAFPGYLGEEVFRPAGAAGGGYRIVCRFDSLAHLHSWLDSGERAPWMTRRATRRRPDAHPGAHRAGGLGSPSHSARRAPAVPYEMAIRHLGDDLPLITVVVAVSAPSLGPLPLIPRLALTTLATASLMTWVAMPRVTALLRRWLYPDRRR